MIVHLCQTTSLSILHSFPLLISLLPPCLHPLHFPPTFSSSPLPCLSSFLLLLFLLPLPPLSSLPSSQVITLHRPLRCCHWCCFCCLQEVEVQSPPGSTIGYIQQDFTFLYPWFTIQDEDRETLLKLKGPCCYCMCGDVEFEVRAEWVSGCMGVWLYGCMAIWVSGCMGVWLYGCLAIWVSGCMGVWLYGCLAVWVSGYMGVWLCGCLSVCVQTMCSLR